MRKFKYTERLSSGQLRDRVEVWGEVEYENAAGEIDTRYEMLKKVWATVIPQTGKLQEQPAETILTHVTHKIIMRYGTNDDITKEMEIRFRGHRFKIRHILEPYFLNRTLEIFVEEVLE